ncbi:DNA recombination protein RmuC [Zophobihabitans entericus]|uniref:DNA recombination protein RmuC n=1 Tax=Zophobihabitans entericus TaxID=1635327 RepID=A0A6G9IBV5_9GAMM|nr:DNA recombination protein RmuC [Zophobihabitans entericus]QIQ21711.1 DNA recombination protein RmuC [Zophobihabitans entericus]
MNQPELLMTATIILAVLCLILCIYAIKSRLNLKSQQQIAELQLRERQQDNLELATSYQKAEETLQQLYQERSELNIKYAALAEKAQQIPLYQQQQEKLLQELNQLRLTNTQLYAELAEAKTRLEETRSAADEKQRLLIQSEQRLTEQFENLANRIFDQSGKKFEQQNKQSLDLMLSPLKEQLEGFKKQVQDSYNEEAKERHTLAFEIRHLKQLNEQMAKDAVNLTNALKGNNKTQGNWGEVVLSRVLESSGLREGYEYDVQASLQKDDGSNGRSQPDVLVHLPHGHDVVIDAKMTLVAYERYFNSDDEQKKEQALSEHLISVRSHIKQLSQKDYHKLLGIKSLDYILMFIPVEPAFVAAIDRDPTLINEALKNNIILVSPTTLLVALRTINNLWRYDNQNRNAQEIAEKASKLYDKMRGFVEDMENLGNIIERSQDTFQSAMNKLSRGRGNVIGQLEQFREQGIEVKKPINPQIAEIAQEESELKPENTLQKLE